MGIGGTVEAMGEIWDARFEGMMRELRMVECWKEPSVLNAMVGGGEKAEDESLEGRSEKV